MPEFPLLKSQIGQVEWNGGSSTLSTSHSSKTIPHHSSIRSTPLSTSTFVLEYTIACYIMNHTVTYCTPRHNKRTVARIRHRTCKPYIVQRIIPNEDSATVRKRLEGPAAHLLCLVWIACRSYEMEPDFAGHPCKKCCILYTVRHNHKSTHDTAYSSTT